MSVGRDGRSLMLCAVVGGCVRGDLVVQARWEADLAIASEVAVNLLPPPSAETIHSARERSKAQRRLAVGTAAGPNTAGTTEVAAPLPGNAIGQPAP